MRKLITILFIIVLTTKSTFGQDTNSCTYPVHVSLDSLLKYIDADFNKKIRTPTVFANRMIFFKGKPKSMIVKYNQALNKCEDYLIGHLGKSFYCNFIIMDVNNFFGPYGHNNNLVLQYGLQLPNIINEHDEGNSCYFHYQYEVITIEFKIELQSDSSLSIVYPKNVPECNGLPDCGITITKDSAIAIAKKINFFHNSTKYYINTDGISWNIELEDSEGEVRSIKINLKTGAISNFSRGHRID